MGDGSVRVVLSSWRRRLVDGGVGEREVVAIFRLEIKSGRIFASAGRDD